MKRQFTRVSLIAFVLCSGVLTLAAQQKESCPKFQASIGITDFDDFLDFNNVYGNYQVSLSYKVVQGLSFGIQGAWAGAKISNADGTTPYAGNIWSYNLAASFYFLELLSQNTERKFQPYLKGKVGAYRYHNLNEIFMAEEKSYFDYGVYLGLEYWPIKRAAVFAEIGYGKRNFNQFGVSFRF